MASGTESTLQTLPTTLRYACGGLSCPHCCATQHRRSHRDNTPSAHSQHACKDVLERVALDGLGVAAVSLVAATLYRAPALCGCRQCSRAARDPFRAGPRDWDIHARGLAKDVAIDLVHTPLALVVLLAPWRVPQCWRSMRHGGLAVGWRLFGPGLRLLWPVGELTTPRYPCCCGRC